MSPVERRVLEGFARGLNARQIAGELFLAPSTVNVHTKRVRARMGVTTTAAAVTKAQSHHLIDLVIGSGGDH